MLDIETISEISVLDLDEEGQPLLQVQKINESTPLPAFQLAVICFAKFSGAVAYTQIFPYANEMIEDLHIASSSEVGYYFGLIAGIEALVQIFTVYQWGKLSDRIGRKPIVVIGLTGMTLSASSFGFSTSFWQLVLSRGLSGALSANDVIINAIAGDITDETNQSKAFPFLAVAWCIGCAVGPLIGGMLSRPVGRYPDVFRHFKFLDRYPFLLPCLVSSLTTVTALVCILLLLNETAPQKARKTLDRQPLGGDVHNITNIYGPTSPVESTPPPSANGLLKNKKVVRLICSEFLLVFVGYGFRRVFALWAHTPVKLGGLGRLPSEIGPTLAIGPGISIFFVTFIFPKLHARWDTPSLFVRSMSIFPVVFLMTSLNSLISHAVLRPDSMVDGPGPLGVLWIGVVTIILLERFACLATLASSLMVKRVSPSAESLGAMFGLLETASCIGEASGPAFLSSLFAFSAKEQLMGGQLVWIVMIVVSVVGLGVAAPLRRL